MPCDSVVVFDGQLDKCKNWDLLEAAATEAGWYVYRVGKTTMNLSKGGVSVQLTKGGKARITGGYSFSQTQADQVTKELTGLYAKKVITTSAKKWGWNPTEQPNGKIRLTRRF